MMKNKLFALLLCFVLTAGACFTVGAAEERYTDEDTGFRVVIIDELDLLTDEEEAKLTEDMKPLTQYGSIAFWTTDEFTNDEIDQARLKRKELFAYESAGVFAVNMKVRKLTIQSYGEINSNVTDSMARSITDNVSRYASSKDYYACAATAFSQMLDACEHRHVSEPMKVTGFAVLSVMAGLIIALGVAFSKRHNPLQSDNPAKGAVCKAEGGFAPDATLRFVSSKTEHRAPRVVVSSGRSGCSSCSSGSSCSSCSSGSSCSSCGGGGCGSGGSSSF